MVFFPSCYFQLQACSSSWVWKACSCFLVARLSVDGIYGVLITICHWYLWGSNCYSTEAPGTVLRYAEMLLNVDSTLPILVVGPFDLNSFLLPLPPNSFSYLWGIWEKVLFVLHYETAPGFEITWGTPSAHGSISEHIALLALTLVGEPRHQCCDQ